MVLNCRVAATLVVGLRREKGEGGGLGVRKGSRGYKFELLVSSSSLPSPFCEALRVWPQRLGENAAQTLSSNPHSGFLSPGYKCVWMYSYALALDCTGALVWRISPVHWLGCCLLTLQAPFSCFELSAGFAVTSCCSTSSHFWREILPWKPATHCIRMQECFPS